MPLKTQHRKQQESFRTFIFTQLMKDLDQLVQAHTDIDVEMKLEGDRLLKQARLIALGLVAGLGSRGSGQRRAHFVLTRAPSPITAK